MPLLHAMQISPDTSCPMSIELLPSASPTPEPETKRRSSKRVSLQARTPVYAELSPLPYIGGSLPVLTPESPSKHVTLSYNKQKWQEPVPDEPAPVFTGAPLAAFPLSKVKKESLWPKNLSARRKGSQSKSQTPQRKSGESSQESTRESTADAESRAEEKLILSLQTAKSEAITTKSTVRESLDGIKAVPKPGSTEVEDNSDVRLGKRGFSPPSTPTQTPRLPSQTSPDDAKKKRIKFSSPKKPTQSTFGFDGGLTGKPRAATVEASDPTRDNEDFCAACGEPGIFLCCEACPKSFHFACCDPPFDEDSLPDDAWFCRECYVKAHPAKTYLVGMFSKLMNQMERRNPNQFLLPKRIVEYFDGVSANAYGEYQDQDLKPEIKLVRTTKEDVDPVLDKHGRPLICYRCKGTGLEQPITTCEYCPLSWHLDCLSPPLATIKTLGSKWKCPNHTDDLVLERERAVLKGTIVDISVSHGFRNNGNIEVDLELYDYLDEEMEPVVLPTPPYFESHATENGVAAPASRALRRAFSIDGVKYRIPEKGILLDFITATKWKNEAEREEGVEGAEGPNSRGRAEDATQEVIEKAIQEATEEVNSEGPEKKGIKLESVSGITTSPILEETRSSSNALPPGDPPGIDETNFSALVRVALSDLEVLGLCDIIDAKQQKARQSLDYVVSGDDVESLAEGEIEDLLQIKRLLQAKGRASVLAFLKS
ncbi:hypothetical protein BABINDRAFT_160119 [Babjeviella inositovora NRRL Y-12698]|uniref:PHD-type domain-containing protein n=1 Tax=Babjeviella inositovora NRRL Y-12698 TaxID=984486 RepID=A0A1E3QXW4_9ASCO|nr:uncharacterized protein BABINDRAFT_160119 [Babjeviella inositovora NRRL Y-12698]ODQ81887.1 hypothetical protein BABINDRAFT_160119 [Babjeviella inositovora NRRL Y-12698]